MSTIALLLYQIKSSNYKTINALQYSFINVDFVGSFKSVKNKTDIVFIKSLLFFPANNLFIIKFTFVLNYIKTVESFYYKLCH